MNWGTAADAASRARARRTQLSTRTSPFTGCGRNTGGSGDSDTLPRQDTTTMSGPESPGDCHVVIRYEGAQPRPGQWPRASATTKDPNQNWNSATTGPGTGSPNDTYQTVTRIHTNRGQALVENTPQVNCSRNSVPTIRTGRTRTPNLMEHSTDSTDGKYFQISTRLAPCNKFGIYPLRTRTCYQREHIQALQAYAIFRISQYCLARLCFVRLKAAVRFV
jgi:hypothetical protein